MTDTRGANCGELGAYPQRSGPDVQKNVDSSSRVSAAQIVRLAHELFPDHTLSDGEIDAIALDLAERCDPEGRSGR